MAIMLLQCIREGYSNIVYIEDNKVFRPLLLMMEMFCVCSYFVEFFNIWQPEFNYSVNVIISGQETPRTANYVPSVDYMQYIKLIQLNSIWMLSSSITS